MLKNVRPCGETHVEVKKCKKLTASAFGSWVVEKVHAIVAQSKFRSQNAPQCRSSFGSWDVENVHAAVAQSTCRILSNHVEVKIVKAPHAPTSFGRWSVFRGRRKGFCTLPKVS
jgi:hypothetical protein